MIIGARRYIKQNVPGYTLAQQENSRTCLWPHGRHRINSLGTFNIRRMRSRDPEGERKGIRRKWGNQHFCLPSAVFIPERGNGGLFSNRSLPMLAFPPPFHPMNSSSEASLSAAPRAALPHSWAWLSAPSALPACKGWSIAPAWGLELPAQLGHRMETGSLEATEK